MVERWPIKYKVLGSIPSTGRKLKPMVCRVKTHWVKAPAAKSDDLGSQGPS